MVSIQPEQRDGDKLKSGCHRFRRFTRINFRFQDEGTGFNLWKSAKSVAKVCNYDSKVKLNRHNTNGVTVEPEVVNCAFSD